MIHVCHIPGYLGNASSIRVYLRTSIEGVLLMLRKLSLIAAMAAALAFPSAALAHHGGGHGGGHWGGHGGGHWGGHGGGHWGGHGGGHWGGHGHWHHGGWGGYGGYGGGGYGGGGYGGGGGCCGWWNGRWVCVHR